MVYPSSGRDSEWLRSVDLNSLSDEDYFLRMRACERRVCDWGDRYIGLLIGANDRDLPQKCGFKDIFHMAAIQARMTRQRV